MDLRLPVDYALYLYDPLRHSSTALAPALRPLKTWTSSRAVAQKLTYLNIANTHIPLPSPFSSSSLMPVHQHASTASLDSRALYLLWKCDPNLCELLRELHSSGAPPHLLSQSKPRPCRHCPDTDLSLALSATRFHSLTDSVNCSSAVLLCQKTASIDTASLSHSDLFWIRYFLSHGGAVISDSRLEYEFNRLFYRERILFSSPLSAATLLPLLRHPHQSFSSLTSGSTELLSPALRCEVFAAPHAFSPNVNPHSDPSATSAAPLTLSGTLASQSPEHLLAFSNQFTPPSHFRVQALMAGFNEGDVLASSVSHLIQQGCHVHYLDNWSTDDTPKVIQHLHALYPETFTSETFPPDSRPETFNWEDLLTKKKILSETSPFDWFIHVDPDELRESPWGPNISLRQALFIADRLHFNLINFAKLVIFHPVAGERIFEPGDDLRTAFKYFEMNSFHGNNYQLKAWKSYGHTAFHNATLAPQHSRPAFFDLVTYGGHAGKYIPSGDPQKAAFVPRSEIFPLKFVLRHYPFRSEAHGRKKVFEERKGRWNKRERRDYGWHIQYDQMGEDYAFVRAVDSPGLRSLRPNTELPSELYETILPCPPEP
jgi:hypothetical protein